MVMQKIVCYKKKMQILEHIDKGIFKNLALELDIGVTTIKD